MRIKTIVSAVVLASVLFTTTLLEAVHASTPYEAYNYNYWEEAVASPAAFVPSKTVSGTDLGIGPFLEPNDMVIGSDGKIYVADTGNKRIVIINPDWTVHRIIDSVDGLGAFGTISGLFVDEDQALYIADSGLGKLIVLHDDGAVKLIIDNPQSDIIAAGFKFTPMKVAVDSAKRMYVVASGVFEGIMQFDTDGEFLGYIGTNEVKRDYYEIIWRLFSTKEQRSQMVLFIPTEFSNLDIDQKGFVYATNIDLNSPTPIKRLNPSGEDVLKRYGYFHVKGDIRFRLSVGPSIFVDIKYLGDGIYSALDSNQGKVFTYDSEGNLLFIYGMLANQSGTFKTPVAIEYDGVNQLVLDRAKANIHVFKPTLFGELVLEASRLHYNGYSEQAVPIWQQVLDLNSNYDIAYIGIGRSLVMSKRNEEAIFYFEQGMERDQYSVAFKRYRREEMKEQFGSIMTTIVIAAVIIIGIMIWRKVRSKRQGRTTRYSAGRDQAL